MSKMDDRNFIGVFIPAKLYLDRQLSWIEKLLIVEIESLSDEKEPCHASNEHFANHLGISKDRVSRIINKLIKDGYIISKIIYKDGTKLIKKRWLLVNHDTYSYFQLEGIGENTDRGIGENTEVNKVNNKNIKEKYKKEKFDEELFSKFWNSYPKKKSKGNAEAWFQKNTPSEELVDLMISKIELLKQTDQWKSDNGKFIPYPATWLNAKGWEDEVNVKPKVEKRFL